MKKIDIRILIDEKNNKMATATNMAGYDNSISDQLEILGIMANLVELQKEKLKSFGRWSGK